MSELEVEKMMQWLKLYFFVSLVIGIGTTIRELRNITREQLTDLSDVQEKFAKQHESKGNLQIERYGDRTVYYRKNLKGESVTTTLTFFKKLAEEHPSIWIFIIFVGLVIMMTISWPKDGFDYLAKKVRDSKPPS